MLCNVLGMLRHQLVYSASRKAWSSGREACDRIKFHILNAGRLPLGCAKEGSPNLSLRSQDSRRPL
ncbi:hypothetical protein CABS01_04995 [Colletotrichum abscissum]|uniref:uncharacterized protein n=1 Tax=Colletotrichum abscissum TaxID=1671311 RepID=UPI0027D4AF48|nr:uncharacterized protein CABS01_04995 [Colletotrichum abscissum]KAK1523374.1 hypothetical protein CABS01_04995 [Colletotrichum abscissum]